MASLLNSKWIKIDIVVIVWTILLIILYGGGVPIAWLWSILYFAIPAIIIASLVNLIIGAVIAIIRNEQVRKEFLSTKLLLFFLSNLLFLSAGDFPANIPINISMVLFILLFILSQQLENRTRGIVILGVSFLYLFPGILSEIFNKAVNDAVYIDDAIIRWYLTCLMLSLSQLKPGRAHSNAVD